MSDKLHIKRFGGFTLIETVVVVAILIVLMSFLIPGSFMLSRMIEHQRTASVLNTAHGIVDELKDVHNASAVAFITASSDSYAIGNHPAVMGPPPGHVIGGLYVQERYAFSHTTVRFLTAGNFYQETQLNNQLKVLMKELDDYLIAYYEPDNHGAEPAGGKILVDAWGNPVEFVTWVTNEESFHPMSDYSYVASAGPDGQWGDVTPNDVEMIFDGEDITDDPQYFSYGTVEHNAIMTRSMQHTDKSWNGVLDHQFDQWDYRYSLDNLYSVELEQ